MQYVIALLAAVTVAVPVAAQQVQRTAATVLPTLKPGARLRIEAGSDRLIGRLDSLTGESAFLAVGGQRRAVPIRDINGLWVRRGRGAKGALIGGVLGAAVLTGVAHLMVSGLCDDVVTGCHRDHQRAWGYGIILGGTGGALVGAGIGSFVTAWERRVP